MKIKVKLERTINTGNYENIKPAIEVEDKVGIEETPEEAFRRLISLRDKLFGRDVKLLLRTWEGK